MENLKEQYQKETGMPRPDTWVELAHYSEWLEKKLSDSYGREDALETEMKSLMEQLNGVLG